MCGRLAPGDGVRLRAGLLEDTDLDAMAGVTWRWGMLLYKAGCGCEPWSGLCVWLLRASECKRVSLAGFEIHCQWR